MEKFTLLNLYFSVLLLASITALSRFRHASLAIKFLCCHVLLAMFTELISYFQILDKGQNILISNGYDYLYLICLLGYFLAQPLLQRRRKYFVILGVLLFLGTSLSIGGKGNFITAHQENVEYAIGLSIIFCSLVQIYAFAVQTQEKTTLLDKQLLIPLLFVSYQTISLWCKSVAYSFDQLTANDIQMLYHLILMTNIFYYVCLAFFLFKSATTKNKI